MTAWQKELLEVIAPGPIQHGATYFLLAAIKTMNRPGHDKYCKDVHCMVHEVMSSSNEPKRFCLIDGFYKASRFPGVLFCRECIDKVSFPGTVDLGTVTPYEL